MSGAEVEHEFARVPENTQALIVDRRAQQAEEQRVVGLIRAAITNASVYYYDSVISVRATPDGATRDVVLVPGDRFTVTDTTVIRRTDLKVDWTYAAETAGQRVENTKDSIESLASSICQRAHDHRELGVPFACSDARIVAKLAIEQMQDGAS